MRARSDWEAPVSELTGAITGDGGLQFVDARVAAREAPGPRSTCRFNTRIDYALKQNGHNMGFTLKTQHPDVVASRAARAGASLVPVSTQKVYYRRGTY